MLANETTPFPAGSLEMAGAGTVLLRRSIASKDAVYIESGRVALGVAGSDAQATDAPGPVLEHQLGEVVGPGWLEANAAVLNLPSAVDAVAQTEVTLRRMPMDTFRALLANGTIEVNSVLTDVARAHRQQTELAVSRLAKGAEARCAEWLLRQAQDSDKGGTYVQFNQRKRLVAAQLGIAPETLSRVLRHLRDRRFISGSGRMVNLVDTKALKSLAGN